MSDKAPSVRKFLDLSTSHLPSNEFGEEMNGHPWIVSHRMEFGWFVYCGDSEAQRNAIEMDEPIPNELVYLLGYARGLGCDYILFDADGPVVEGLPIWSW
jgi:hypothetical protein